MSRQIIIEINRCINNFPRYNIQSSVYREFLRSETIAVEALPAGPFQFFYRVIIIIIITRINQSEWIKRQLSLRRPFFLFFVNETRCAPLPSCPNGGHVSLFIDTPTRENPRMNRALSPSVALQSRVRSLRPFSLSLLLCRTKKVSPQVFGVRVAVQAQTNNKQTTSHFLSVAYWQMNQQCVRLDSIPHDQFQISVSHTNRQVEN